MLFFKKVSAIGDWCPCFRNVVFQSLVIGFQEVIREKMRISPKQSRKIKFPDTLF